MEDKRVEVEIELSDDNFLILARAAHEKDITFNQLVNELLREYMKKIESESIRD